MTVSDTQSAKPSCGVFCNAVTTFKTPFWQARTLAQYRHDIGSKRGDSVRFENQRASCSEGGSHFPRSHCNWEIPGSNQSTHTNRFLNNMSPAGCVAVRDHITVEPGSFLCEPFEEAGGEQELPSASALTFPLSAVMIRPMSSLFATRRSNILRMIRPRCRPESARHVGNAADAGLDGIAQVICCRFRAGSNGCFRSWIGHSKRLAWF